MDRSFLSIHPPDLLFPRHLLIPLKAKPCRSSHPRLPFENSKYFTKCSARFQTLVFFPEKANERVSDIVISGGGDAAAGIELLCFEQIDNDLTIQNIDLT